MGKDKKEVVMRPCLEQNVALQQAFDWFNDELFEGKLPGLMLTLSRNNNIVGGFYTPKRWYNEDGVAVAEICINANCLKASGIVRAMSILIHEMAHHWQYNFGTPARGGYHNTEWAKKVKELGLRPFTLDDKETGQAVDTAIIPGGKVESVIADMPEEFILPWMTEPAENPFPGAQEGQTPPGQGGGAGEPRKGPGGPEEGQDGANPEPPRDPSNGEPAPRKAGTRKKYTCPACGFNLWGKSGGHFECMDCNQMIVEMKGDVGDE